MATSESSDRDGGGGGGEKANDLRHPKIDRQWLEVALNEHRAAFEHEMERKRQLFDRELRRFCRAKGPTA